MPAESTQVWRCLCQQTHPMVEKGTCCNSRFLNMLQFQIFEQLAPRTGAAIMYGFRPPSCSYPCEVLVSVPSNAIWHGASMESISITAIARNGRSKNGDTHGPRNLFHFGRHFFLKPCFFPGGSRHPSCLW